jgi:glutamine---fructose-6-phosphate transaminase (isomerizing)
MARPPSAMAATMARQPDDLRRLLDDVEPVERAAERLRGCGHVVLFGTGTSFHAAAVGAWFFRQAGVEAWGAPSADAVSVLTGSLVRDTGVIAISHSGDSGSSVGGRPKLATRSVVGLANELGLQIVTIGAREVSGADVETVERETSSAHTASYLGALLRLAQLSGSIGAPLDGLEAVPNAVADALARDDWPDVSPPDRLMEFVGSGPNAWTAAEGALKVRETARVASEGHNAEQCLHGPLVALDQRDVLVALDGGDEGAGRVHDVARLAEEHGVRVHLFEAPKDVRGPLTVFPLTVAVQRVALRCAETLGIDPDAFGFDVPGRREVWGTVPL